MSKNQKRLMLSRYFTLGAAILAGVWVVHIAQVFAQTFPVTVGGNDHGVVNVTHYGNHNYQGIPGVHINVVYEGNLTNTRWLQFIVNATTPAGGRNVPYVDPPNDPNGPAWMDNEPFYYTNNEEGGQHSGNNYNFEDLPGRGRTPCETWQAELWLTRVDGRNIEILQCITYGWHVENDGSINEFPVNEVGPRTPGEIENILNEHNFPGWNVTIASVEPPSEPPGDCDHDGVPDVFDRCPTEPYGFFDVDGDGCGDGGTLFRKGPVFAEAGKEVRIPLDSNYNGRGAEFLIVDGNAEARIENDGVVPELVTIAGPKAGPMQWQVQMLVPFKEEAVEGEPVPNEKPGALSLPAVVSPICPKPVYTNVLTTGPIELFTVEVVNALETANEVSEIEEGLDRLLHKPVAGDGGRVLQLGCGRYDLGALSTAALELTGGFSSGDPLIVQGRLCLDNEGRSGRFNGRDYFVRPVLEGNLRVTGSHVRVRDLALLGTLTVEPGARRVPTDIRMENLRIRPQVPGQAAVTVTDASSVQLLGSSIEGGRVGVLFEDSTDVRVEGNHFEGQTQILRFQGMQEGSVTVLDNRLQTNERHNSAVYAFRSSNPSALREANRNLFLCSDPALLGVARLGRETRIGSLERWQEVSQADAESRVELTGGP